MSRLVCFRPESYPEPQTLNPKPNLAPKLKPLGLQPGKPKHLNRQELLLLWGSPALSVEQQEVIVCLGFQARGGMFWGSSAYARPLNLMHNPRG